MRANRAILHHYHASQGTEQLPSSEIREVQGTVKLLTGEDKSIGGEPVAMRFKQVFQVSD